LTQRRSPPSAYRRQIEIYVPASSAALRAASGAPLSGTSILS
jgi:hypothetical protein